MKSTNEELIKLARTLIPERIAKEIVSVQPMDDIDVIALAQALDNYVWLCPVMAAAFNKKDTTSGTS